MVSFYVLVVPVLGKMTASMSVCESKFSFSPPRRKCRMVVSWHCTWTDSDTAYLLPRGRKMCINIHSNNIRRRRCTTWKQQHTQTHLHRSLSLPEPTRTIVFVSLRDNTHTATVVCFVGWSLYVYTPITK